MVLRYCPSSQFGSYQGGFRIVRPTTTGVAISVVPLMFRLGTAKYVHAVIVGGDRNGSGPLAIRKRRLPPGGTRKGRNPHRFRPLCIETPGPALFGSGGLCIEPLDLPSSVPGVCVL